MPKQLVVNGVEVDADMLHFDICEVYREFEKGPRIEILTHRLLSLKKLLQAIPETTNPTA